MTTERSPRHQSLQEAARTPEGRLLLTSALGAVAAFAALHGVADQPHGRLSHIVPVESVSYKDVQADYWSEVSRHKGYDATPWPLREQGTTFVDMPKAVMDVAVGKQQAEPNKAIGADKMVGSDDANLRSK